MRLDTQKNLMKKKIIEKKAQRSNHRFKKKKANVKSPWEGKQKTAGENCKSSKRGIAQQPWCGWKKLLNALLYLKRFGLRPCRNGLCKSDVPSLLCLSRSFMCLLSTRNCRKQCFQRKNCFLTCGRFFFPPRPPFWKAKRPNYNRR